MVNKISYLFPGQGSQIIGMGRSYAEKSKTAMELFQKADRILGFSLSDIMWNGPEEKLKQTEFAQPALYTASAAGLELLKERGLQPFRLAGHSLGEYSALYAGGVFSFEEGLQLVYERGKAMSEAGKKNPGTMAAIIGFPIETLEYICKEVSNSNSYCGPANYNSDSQVVISGHIESVKLAMEKCTSAGAAKTIQLNVAGAFHSPLMNWATQVMSSKISQLSFNDAKVPVVTNVDSKDTLLGNDFKSKLIKQIENAVLWDPTLKKLNELGTEIFIEVGPGRVLSTMAKKLDRKKTVLCTDEWDALDKALSLTASH